MPNIAPSAAPTRPPTSLRTGLAGWSASRAKPCWRISGHPGDRAVKGQGRPEMTKEI